MNRRVLGTVKRVKQVRRAASRDDPPGGPDGGKGLA